MIDELGARKWFAELSKLNIIPPVSRKTSLERDLEHKVENGQQFFFGTDGKYHARLALIAYCFERHQTVKTRL